MSKESARTPPSLRRHDLDALRAAAMLLGLAYHAALPFAAGFPWLVRDVSQSRGLYLFQAASHGFRMPLFFLLSGFFTAMMWRKRGLKALLKQRFQRILLPCLLGLVTVVPATMWLSGKAVQSNGQRQVQLSPQAEGPDLWSTVTQGDADAVNRILAEGADPNARHPQFGYTPLTAAALLGHTRIVTALLDGGANVNGRNSDGGTALHAAAFLGRADSAELLIARGADVAARNSRGEPAMHAARVDWPTTRLIAGFLRIELARQQVEAGREQILGRLQELGAPDAQTVGSLSPTQRGNIGSGPWLRLAYGLMVTPVFAHLWFLWFLCWLVAAFALYALIARWIGWKGPPSRWLLSPVGLALPILATLIPQGLMGASNAGFGPDTSIGILPMPHVLLYYALFFGFGVLYYECGDADSRLGRNWRWTLPATLILVFPPALEFGTGTLGFRDAWLPAQYHAPAAVVLQTVYAWWMTFACLGMFRSLLTGENRTIRYLSDSAYWLYLTHLPLMIGTQILIRNWRVPAIVKCLLLTVVVTGLLLLVYDKLVRYRWLGTLLNGPRSQPTHSARCGAESSTRQKANTGQRPHPYTTRMR